MGKQKNISHETCFMGKHRQTYLLDHQHKMHQMRNSHWCCQLSLAVSGALVLGFLLEPCSTDDDHDTMKKEMFIKTGLLVTWFKILMH